MKSKSSSKYDKTDIQDYLSGHLDMEARLRLEKIALEDPFLLTALKGYNEHTSDAHVANLENLRSKLNQTSTQRSKSIFIGLQYAASVAIIFGLFYGAWQFSSDGVQSDTVATYESATEEMNMNVQNSPIQGNPESSGEIPVPEMLTTTENKGTDTPLKKVTNDAPVKHHSPEPKIDQKSEDRLAQTTSIQAQKEVEESEPIEQIETISQDQLGGVSYSMDLASDDGNIVQETPPKSTVMLLNSADSIRANTASSEPILIAGKVVDELGETLPFVTVVWQGTDIGTTTDILGHFEIKKLDHTADLEFSYIGYQSIQMSSDELSDSDLNVVLMSEGVALDEVVVIDSDQSSKLKKRAARTNTRKPEGVGRPVFVEIRLEHNLDEIIFKSDINKMEHEIADMIAAYNPKSIKTSYEFTILKTGKVTNIRTDISNDPEFHKELEKYLEGYIFYFKNDINEERTCELIIEIE